MSFDENLINNPSKGMPRLLEIMRALRDPESGCPWDIEQNFKTIAPYTVEEAYEVADAIERENWEELKNELGDLLLQTVYHTQMAEEEDLFNFNEVVNQISEKMIQRHPHVFGNENRNKTASQQVNDWESIKAEERSKKDSHEKGFLNKVQSSSKFFFKELNKIQFDYPNVIQEIRGKGLLIGLKLKVEQGAFIKKLSDNKLLTIKAADNVIRILPPLNVSIKEIKIALNILKKVCKSYKKS